jgi:hypothetical protein
VSPLRDSASWIWPGGMCWHRSLAALAVRASETQQGVPRATTQDADDILSWRLLASEPGEKRTKTTRRQRWTNRR